MVAPRFKLHNEDLFRRAFDEYGYAVATIPWEHRLIHEGWMHRYPAKITIATSGTFYNFLIVCPAGGEIHWSWTFSADEKARLHVFENPTVTANGADDTAAVYNVKRSSALTLDTTIYSGATVSANGDLRECRYIDKEAGGHRAENEIEMAENTTILFQIEALKNDSIAHIQFDMYDIEAIANVY